MAALGGLLGAYGSDDEDSTLQDSQPEETQKTGQVTLLGDEEDDAGGLDLSHLTSGAAARAAAEADTAAAAQGAGAAPADGAGEGAAEPMEQDGAPVAAAGAAGGEQPAAAAEQAADPRDLLPPELREPPEGECYPDIQARIVSWMAMQQQRGRYFNDSIRQSRGYRNPEFFAKMVEHLEIAQHGTAFAPEVFDPKALPPEDYLDALQREWAAEDERRRAARAAGHGRVEFHKSASNPTLAQPALKPGLQPPPAAVAAAKAAAAQQSQIGLQQAGLSSAAAAATAAAVAAAQAKATALAAQLARR